MIEITEHQWRQLIEGAYRSDDPYVYQQANRTEGNDCIREYLLEGVVIARMRVIGGVDVRSSYDRVYQAEASYLPLVEHIYLLTEADDVYCEENDIDPNVFIAQKEQEFMEAAQ